MFSCPVFSEIAMLIESNILHLHGERVNRTFNRYVFQGDVASSATERLDFYLSTK